jgi:hypothetical protein
MQREPVDSSVLRSVGYEDGALEIEFVDGDVYRYFAVPAQIYADLIDAESHGAFFNEQVRDRFRFERRS